MNLKLTLFKIALLTILHAQPYISLGTELKSYNDSCNSTIDSIEIFPLVDKPFQQSSLKAQSKAVFFDFIEDAWNAITSPLKPVWGYYEESGQRTTGPYTVFQQHQGFQIDRLRTKIQNTNDPYFKFYTHIYENAVNGTTQNCTNNGTVCLNGNTAKNAAFVYLIGIKIVYNFDKNPISTIDLTLPERSVFKTKAENIIKSAYAVGLDNGLDDLVSIPIFGYLAGNAPLISINLVNGIASWNKVYWRSRELVSLLQAFDMLKWAYYVDGTLPNEQASSNTRIMADRLKDRYIVPLYRRATGAIYPYTNNNYGLMAGCALGMSAIV
jgi:hypothetical protein